MIAGRWNIVLETPMGPKQGVLELRADGDQLSGSMSDGVHHAALVDGRIQGSHLRWSAKISTPMRITVKFTATVEGDRISGSAKHLLGRASFVGTRV